MRTRADFQRVPGDKQEAAFLGELLPTTKPDVDNIVKCLLDAMSGIVFVDDKNVVSVTAEKSYDSDDECKVFVEPI